MTDPREQQFAAERDAAISIAHKAMQSSYIGPPPKLRGDAERMVDALITAGWGPQAPEVSIGELVDAVRELGMRHNRQLWRVNPSRVALHLSDLYEIRLRAERQSDDPLVPIGPALAAKMLGARPPADTKDSDA